MIFHIRSNMMVYYRLFFIALFFVLGTCAVGTVLLERYADISIIITQSAIDKQALHVTLSTMGMFGIATASIMIFLMRERRSSAPDRRQKSSPVETGRRRNIDRRTAWVPAELNECSEGKLI